VNSKDSCAAKPSLNTLEFIDLIVGSYFAEIGIKKLKYNLKLKEIIMKNQQEHVFEGTLVAAGWDKSDLVNKSSLYTQEDEDIMLDHDNGIAELKPFINHKVRVSGVITSRVKNGRGLLIKEINKLSNGFSRSVIPTRDEFDNLILTLQS
jgi:hypothetical protein